jgi:hypothetical protein
MIEWFILFPVAQGSVLWNGFRIACIATLVSGSLPFCSLPFVIFEKAERERNKAKGRKGARQVVSYISRIMALLNLMNRALGVRPPKVT